MRIFFAAEVDNILNHAAVNIIEYLSKQSSGDRIKWQPAEKLHMTLRFLGGVAPEKIPELIEKVTAEVKSINAFSIELGKVITFPASHPHIIAISIKLSDELINLAAAIERGVNQCGFVPATRPYFPHLTLGRLRGKQFPDISCIPVEIPKSLAVNQVILFRSDTGENGSVYTPLAKLPMTLVPGSHCVLMGKNN